MDSLTTTSVSNRRFLDFTWGSGKTAGRYQYLGYLARDFFPGVSHGPAAREKDGNLKWPGFSPENARADLHAILLHGWTGAPGGRC